MERVKVAAYCRVSTDSDDQLNSLDNQTQYFREHCAQRSDYDLTYVYADRGLSGTSWSKREEFKRMLEDAGIDISFYRGELRLSDSGRAPKFTRILVKDPSRFSRNVGNAKEIFARLSSKGVYVDFITANLSTEGMADSLLLGILTLLAEGESQDRSVKVKFGQRQGARNGVIMGADILYGYRRTDTRDLEIVPEEADVIRRIFELYNEGNGIRVLTNILREEGVTTRKGVPFALGTIAKMIKNEVYTGKLIRNKIHAQSVFGNPHRKTRPETEWIVHNGRIPAIISREVYDESVTLRTGKVTSGQRRGKRIQLGRYAGKIVCAQCGGSYMRNTETKNGTKFYNCRTKKLAGVRVCSAPNVKEAAVDEVIGRVAKLDMTRWFNAYKADVIGFIDLLLKQPLLARIDADTTAEVARLTGELDAATQRKNRAGQLYVMGTFDEAELADMVSGIDAEVDTLRDTIAELSRSSDDIMAEVASLDECIAEIERHSLNTEEADVLTYIKRMSVQRKDNRVQIMVTLNFGDSIRKYIRLDYAKFFEMMRQYESGSIYDVVS